MVYNQVLAGDVKQQLTGTELGFML